jgi:hypothetical protein
VPWTDCGGDSPAVGSVTRARTLLWIAALPEVSATEGITAQVYGSLNWTMDHRNGLWITAQVYGSLNWSMDHRTGLWITELVNGSLNWTMDH